MTDNALARAGLAAALAFLAGSALASSHLHNALTSEGADNRGFDRPVQENPSGVSGAQADPHAVPGLGNPSTGHGGEPTGTPAVNLDLVPIRSGKE